MPTIPSGQITAGTTPTTNERTSEPRIPPVAMLLIGLFGVLLTSFPARNLDIWRHLAQGRDLLSGSGLPSTTWLYDIATYLVSTVFSESGLVAGKSLLFGFVSVVLFALGTVKNWKISLAVTGLAVLAMSNRFLLQPQSVSVAGLVILLWLIHGRQALRPNRYWPGWPLIALFLIWANVDQWFILGLAVTALSYLGQSLDDRRENPIRIALLRGAVSIAILAVVCCISVSNFDGFRIPAELRAAIVSTKSIDIGPAIHSPFHPTYLAIFSDNSSALAYFPLLAISALSFLLTRKASSWSWFLPWVLLAVVSALEARTIPFFAVVAGPATARNIQTVFAFRSDSPSRKWTRVLGWFAGGVGATVFLVSAWIGLLQGPPYEPRRWSVEMPSALTEGANYLRSAHATGLWPPETKTLHVSADTFGAFAWLIPEDGRIQNDSLITQLLAADRQEEARTALRAFKVNRLVVWAGDPSIASRAMLDRMLADPEEWRLLTLSGGLVVFGWADPASPDAVLLYQSRELNVERLAYQPEAAHTAPATGLPTPRRWWDVFRLPAYPTRPAGRDEAAVLLRRAESLRSAVPYRNLIDWEAGQIVGLAGAAASWFGPAGVSDFAVRLTLFRPPLPTDPTVKSLPQTDMVFAFQQRFAADRGAIPIGDVYAAVRASRRAVAENPTDPQSHYMLARAYSTLANHTSESRWSGRDGIPQIRRVRQVQASAALNQVLTLNPRFATAHRELANLYRTIGCLDLAVEEMSAYLAIAPEWGGPPKSGAAAEEATAEWNRWKKQLEERTGTYERESARMSISDRALLAVQLELGGLARSILLKSDVSAFGAQGVELELDLLLRTGRPQEVLDITTPEVGGSLGDQKYHWTLAQAYLAIGNYELADQELNAMVEQNGTLRPSTVREQIAAVVGKSVLDTQPSSVEWYNVLWLALSRSDLQAQVSEMTRLLGLQANMITLRAIMALEAGNIPHARQQLNAALTYSPYRWGNGQLEFTGRPIVRDCLRLLDQGADTTSSTR
jgi:tetratricopeptide (TPR) repeat protein